MRLLLSFLCAGLIAACSSGSSSSSIDSSSDEVNSEPDLFADKTVIALKVEGAFTTAFRAAHAGEPNGPLPGLPRRVTEDFPGKLTFTTRAGETKVLEATFKVRGNSSLSECPFPKLSMKLTDAGKLAAKNTMFAKQSKLKIGTHCADATDDQGGTIGRLRNEKSPLREAYVYQALATVLPPITLSTRAAKITYVDTAANNATTERSALLLEHIEKLAKRSGSPDEHCRQVDGEEECDPVLTDSEVAAVDPRAGMDRARIAIITIFHAAVGNWDWRLSLAPTSTDGARVWNNEVILLPKEGGPPTELVKLPVAHDFDLASAVTGRLHARAEPTPEKLALQAKEYLARTDGLTAEEVAAAKARFIEKKAALYAVVAAAIIDEPGRANAKAHLDAFFAEITR